MTATAKGDKKLTRLVIVGAGPAGLLAAIVLLRRNLHKDVARYLVTLVDPGVDHGKLDEDSLKRRRSWMIGLTYHGLKSLKEVPGLFEDYVEKLGVCLTGTTFMFGSHVKFKTEFGDVPEEKKSLLCDRNYICSALAKYLNEDFEGDSNFVPMYKTRALFVDAENKHIVVRKMDSSDRTNMTPIDYDIVLGCDGVRSVVRNAFLTSHRDFEFDIQDDFGKGKTIHIDLPQQEMGQGELLIHIEAMPNVAVFCLPGRGNVLNMAAAWQNGAPCHPDLLSDDPKVVAAYFRKHLATFTTVDFDSVAQKWVEQDLISTNMCHCKFYHSSKLRALILGDAAHATVPNIGQGMNTAFADVSTLNALLDKYEDNWDQVLPAFSEERVREGHALTDLSYHTYSVSPPMMLWIVLRQGLQRALNRFIPFWLLQLEPIDKVIAGGKLSEAYDTLTRFGYLRRSRQTNTEIKRSYFERQVGLVKDDKSAGFSSYFVSLVVFVAVVGALTRQWTMAHGATN